VSWDRAQLVGLGIPLRFIAKPSYSPLGTNPNVVCKAVASKKMIALIYKNSFQNNVKTKKTEQTY
jgi:hypothetical protein